MPSSAINSNAVQDGLSNAKKYHTKCFAQEILFVIYSRVKIVEGSGKKSVTVVHLKLQLYSLIILYQVIMGIV